jgi:hypothetical protein
MRKIPWLVVFLVSFNPLYAQKKEVGSFETAVSYFNSILVWCGVPFLSELLLEYAETSIPPEYTYLRNLLKTHATTVRSISSTHTGEWIRGYTQSLVFSLQDDRSDKLKETERDFHHRGLRQQGKISLEASKARLVFAPLKAFVDEMMREIHHALSVESDEQRAAKLFANTAFIVKFLYPEIQADDMNLMMSLKLHALESLKKIDRTEFVKLIQHELESIDSDYARYESVSDSYNDLLSSWVFSSPQVLPLSSPVRAYNKTHSHALLQGTTIALGALFPPLFLQFGKQNMFLEKAVEFSTRNTVDALMRPVLLDAISSGRKSLQALEAQFKHRNEEESVSKTGHSLEEAQRRVTDMLSERSLRMRAQVIRVLALLVPKLISAHHQWTHSEDQALITLADSLIYLRRMSPDSRQDDMFITYVASSLLGALLHTPEIEERILSAIGHLDPQYSKHHSVENYYRTLLTMWIQASPQAKQESPSEDSLLAPMDALSLYGATYLFFIFNACTERYLFNIDDKTLYFSRELFKTLSDLAIRGVSTPAADMTQSIFYKHSQDTIKGADPRKDRIENEFVTRVSESEGRLGVGAQISRAAFERLYPIIHTSFSSAYKALTIRDDETEAVALILYAARFLTNYYPEMASDDESMKRLVKTSGLLDLPLDSSFQDVIRNLLCEEKKSIRLLQQWGILDTVNDDQEISSDSRLLNLLQSAITATGFLLPAVAKTFIIPSLTKQQGFKDFPLMTKVLINFIANQIYYGITNPLSLRLSSQVQTAMHSWFITPRVDEEVNGDHAHKVFSKHYAKARGLFTANAQVYRSHLVLALRVVIPHFAKVRELLFKKEDRSAMKELANALFYLHKIYPDMASDDVYIREAAKVFLQDSLEEKHLSLLFEILEGEDISKEIIEDYFYEIKGHLNS